MGSPSNANPTQLFDVEPSLPTYLSGFMDKTLDPFPNFFDNQNIRGLGLHENKKRKSSLSLLPSHVNAHSPLLGSPVIPRDILFQKELEHELKYGHHKLDPNIDMKKLRRIISNRLSAQRSRVKRVQYTLDLEKKVGAYRDIIWTLTPQVERQKEKGKSLSMENDYLQKELERMANEETLREMEEEALKFEIQKLKEVNNGGYKWHMQDPNPEPVPDLNLDLTLLHPYPTLSFYQESMQNLHTNNALKKIVASDSTFVEDEEVSIFDMAQEPVEPNQELEEDVDQYFNFDDEVNLDEIIFV